MQAMGQFRHYKLPFSRFKGKRFRERMRATVK
jgi:hypothetical protein